MRLQRNKPAKLGLTKAVLGIALLSVAVFSATGAPLQAQTRTCSLEVRSQYDSDSQEMQRFLQCLNARISDLRRVNQQLQRRIAKLEEVAGALPAPWSNVDGVITQDLNRPVGSATLVLSSRSTGGASALEIDQDVMESLCVPSGGCSVVVTYKQVSVFNKTPTESEISGPCQFTYERVSGDWGLGAGCGFDQAVSGSDGDGGLGADQSNSVEIASAGRACILADSGLEKAVGEEAVLGSDRGKGLFLIAIPARQTGVNRRFQCELTLE